ncbi:hypothetical protein SISNIDRAFT_481773 [Sistotremastrum niveocremeum HHB9708]|uniref:DNA recombination and repair protein Rad51-like C-terminal domain-containing protein n=1 Tax=Sistotremastrum niveocremeum HHB9708 TaxID=1314777 RepID=A0A164ZNU0_9AGAM|nr:hypothetical protein SISNIDRAFT_481773 [Sistotremastrum niveocremeum HHB9708]
MSVIARYMQGHICPPSSPFLIMDLRLLLHDLPSEVLVSLENLSLDDPSVLLFQPVIPPYIRPSVAHKIRKQLARTLSAPGSRGDYEHLHKEATSRQHDSGIYTGLPSLDNILRGLGGPCIVEFAGSTRSVISTILLHLAVHHLTRHSSSSVLWIDTTGTFDGSDAENILESLHSDDKLQRPSVVKKEEEEALGSSLPVDPLDRLQIAHSVDTSELLSVLDLLRTYLTTDQTSDTLRYVIIDSINTLFSPNLSSTSSHGHAVMSSIMHQLSLLARTFVFTVLVSNGSVPTMSHNPASSFCFSRSKPALGPTFTFLTDDTIWLTQAPDNKLLPQDDPKADLYIAEHIRSRTKRSRSWTLFCVRGRILEDGS